MAGNCFKSLGVEIPIVQAPMGGAVGPELAAAVSNAEALGAMPLWGDDAATIRRQVAAFRALSDGPLLVNLNLN